MSGIINSLAEGGQTWAHRVRMLRQVIRIIFMVFLFVFVSTLLFVIFSKHFQLIIALYYHLKAAFFSTFQDKVEINPHLWKQISGTGYGNKSFYLSPNRVLYITHPLVNTLKNELVKSLNISLVTSLTSSMSMALYFLFRGLGSRRKKTLSGSRIVNPSLLTWRLKISNRASKIQIAKLPYVKNTESMHTLITGGTGSGKTNCLHHLISSIRKNKSKAIVVDTTGAFVSKYYREGKDKILNPFDDRGVDWSPWAECKSKYDFEEIAESFIPLSNNDSEEYWRKSARSLFSSLLIKVETRSISELVQRSLYSSLKDLADFVKGTKAAAHIDLSSEKTAGSIRSVASSYLNCLEYLNDSATSFSIKDWIKDEDDSFLFICCKPSQRSSISPLLSTWISVSVRGILDLEPSRSRKVWFILDELPTLNKVKGIETLLTEGRKYGACAVLALQSPSQLDSIYGTNTSRIITGNCATKIVFAEHDPEIAERISRVFGTSEKAEYNEGISYGANEVRDGVTLSYQKKREPTVSPDEIQSLKPNLAFIRLANERKITKCKFPFFLNQTDI